MKRIRKESVVMQRITPCTSHSTNTMNLSAGGGWVEEEERGEKTTPKKEISADTTAKTNGGEEKSLGVSKKEASTLKTSEVDTSSRERKVKEVIASKSDEENDPSQRSRVEKKRSYSAETSPSSSSTTPSPRERPQKRIRESSPQIETKTIRTDTSSLSSSSSTESSVRSKIDASNIESRSNTMRPLHLGDDPKKRPYYSPPSSSHGAAATASGDHLGRVQREIQEGLRCRNCRSLKIVTDRREGIVYCSNCGEVVVTKIMMDECEWRIISDGKLNTEGSRVIRRNYMLETFVKRRLRIRECSETRSDGDGRTEGRRSATQGTYPLTRSSGGSGDSTSVAIAIQRGHSLRSETLEIRMLLKQLGRLQTICKYLELKKKVSDHACQFFAHLKSTPDVYGPVRPKKGLRVPDLMAAAIFASCRLNRVAVTRREICAVAKAGKSARCASLFRLLQADLKLEISPLVSGDFLPRLIDLLGLSRAVGRAAQIICSRCGDFGLSPDNAVPAPATTAAAAAYLASQMSNESSALCSDELKELCVRILYLSKRAFRRLCVWITGNLDHALSTDDIDLLSQYGVEVEKLQDIPL